MEKFYPALGLIPKSPFLAAMLLLLPLLGYAWSCRMIVLTTWCLNESFRFRWRDWESLWRKERNAPAPQEFVQVKHKKLCNEGQRPREREGRNRDSDLRRDSRRFLCSETVFGLGTVVFAHDKRANFLFSWATNGCIRSAKPVSGDMGKAEGDWIMWT